MTDSQVSFLGFVALAIGAVFAPTFVGTVALSILAAVTVYAGAKVEERQRAEAEKAKRENPT